MKGVTNAQPAVVVDNAPAISSLKLTDLISATHAASYSADLYVTVKQSFWIEYIYSIDYDDTISASGPICMVSYVPRGRYTVQRKSTLSNLGVMLGACHDTRHLWCITCAVGEASSNVSIEVRGYSMTSTSGSVSYDETDQITSTSLSADTYGYRLYL